MSETQRKLIVNADDLGRTSGINEGIFAAHEKGLVTSATLMVIYPAAEQAADAMKSYPDLGVGLHVQLSGGTPLLPPESIPSLVDEDGRLPAEPDGHTAATADQIRVEVQAQFECFCELTGQLPTHLDGHHHCLRQPMVGEALIEVARQWQLPIRRASSRVAEWLQQTGVPTTDIFLEDFYGARARLDVLMQLLARVEPGTTEIMVHPGISDDGLRSDSSYSDLRERELAILTHPDARRAVEERHIQLIHFGQL